MKKKYTKYLRVYMTPVRLTAMLVVLIATTLLLLLLVTSTTPDQVGPLGVTSLFILVFVVVLSALTLVKMMYKRSTVVTMNGLVGWALIPALFLGLGSLKQLTVVDVILILVFVMLLSFYIRHATKDSKS